MQLIESEFNFLHYEIKNLNINVINKTKKQLSYSTEIGISKINYKEDFAHFGMKLEIKAEADDQIFREIEIEIIGVFDGFKTMGKEKFERFCREAGIPNLLQTARSTISSVTSTMNMYPPVNLPLFNLQESVKNQKKIKN
jgi:preprotein translocase subunit SecB